MIATLLASLFPKFLEEYLLLKMPTGSMFSKMEFVLAETIGNCKNAMHIFIRESSCSGECRKDQHKMERNGRRQHGLFSKLSTTGCHTGFTLSTELSFAAKYSQPF
ncbi:uncharacterized protein LOC117910821 isoform X2 [Vitis riparia]|uniref:uncharacterized protein LOC117910821 isoform X2 n=1 Tax=Vitis riparia TaxID=96939 RepID=UPI00155A15C3|nr:uncharacterized protein LOC117910821 isoform X2 [Vitis riparia]